MKPHFAWPCLLVLLTVFNVAQAADQPQWGQPFSRNMISTETGLPDSFNPETGENIKWSVSLGGNGYGTPTVASGKVLIGANNAEPRDPRHQGDRGVLLCLDESDGSLLWQLVVPRRTDDKYKDWPTIAMCSAPTIEGNRVYTLTNRLELVCLDLDGMADGNDGLYQDEGTHMVPAGDTPMDVATLDADIIWIVDLVEEIGVYPHDSSHTSVLIDGPNLYLNTCNGVDNQHASVPKPDAPSLIVMDKATGKLVAKDNEGIGTRIFHAIWSPPSMGVVAGRKLVFFGGDDGVCYAFDAVKPRKKVGTPEHLNLVWRFDADPTPDRETYSAHLKNRHEGPSNIKAMPVFYKDRVYITVGGDIWWGKKQSWLTCIDATKTGDITDSGARWTYPLNSFCSSTPSIANGLVFVADHDRKVHCIDAETGEAYWTHDLKREAWGSTLVADGKVYIGTLGGDFWILAAEKEKRVIHSTDFGSRIGATPVAANGVLYVNTLDRLYAIDQTR